MYPINQKLVTAGANRTPAMLFEAPTVRDSVQRKPVAGRTAPVRGETAAESEARAAVRFAIATAAVSLVLWAALILTLATGLEVPTVL